jgi:hypothetical protein
MTEDFSQPFRPGPPKFCASPCVCEPQSLAADVSAGVIDPTILLRPVSATEARLRETGGKVRVTLERLMNQP